MTRGVVWISVPQKLVCRRLDAHPMVQGKDDRAQIKETRSWGCACEGHTGSWLRLLLSRSFGLGHHEVSSVLCCVRLP